MHLVRSIGQKTVASILVTSSTRVEPSLMLLSDSFCSKTFTTAFWQFQHHSQFYFDNQPARLEPATLPLHSSVWGQHLLPPSIITIHQQKGFSCSIVENVMLQVASVYNTIAMGPRGVYRRNESIQTQPAPDSTFHLALQPRSMAMTTDTWWIDVPFQDSRSNQKD